MLSGTEVSHAEERAAVEADMGMVWVRKSCH